MSSAVDTWAVRAGDGRAHVAVGRAAHRGLRKAGIPLATSFSDANVVVLGAGNVGGHLLSIIESQRPGLFNRTGLGLRVVGVATRRRSAFQASGLPSARQRPVSGGPSVFELIDRVAALPHPILVDCTASTEMETVYLHAFERGVSVVTANKLPLTLPFARARRLAEAATPRCAVFAYETTVGADLPILGPIADRLASGDVITRIVGSLSGTLGFLAWKTSTGTPLVHAVREARALGYCEPDPAEDLSGRDVARKALILGRELGLDLDLEDVDLEPFVPAEVLARAASSGLESALEEASPAFGERSRALAADGYVLRYLAVIDPAAPARVKVGPVAVDASHPAAPLRGTEALVAVSSERAAGVPLVVRGPGAGGAATASGLYAEIVRAARRAA
jgi:aspartokinase/homoserine dehydrogenase 1